MLNMGKPRSAAWSILAAAAVLFTGAASAEEATTSTTSDEEADDMEVVIVTGIRGSLLQSLDRKRNADHFVDAITAEDIGAFPDQNLAESLQRISGVAIDRKEGEGAFVSVRGLGPQFVQTTIGGRVAASNVDPGQHAGRGQTNRGSRVIGFDSFQSGLVQAVEVHKSPRADHVEGGLGGFIDIQPRKPFDLGERHVAVSLDGTINDLADDTAPGIFALFSDVLSDTVGFMASVQWDNRIIRSDSLHHYSYVPNPTTLTVNGQPMVGYYPRQILGELHVTDRDRLNLSSSLQWRPSDRVDVTFDLLYTDVSNDEKDYWRDFRIQQRLATNVTAATLANDNGTGVFTSLSTSGAGLFVQHGAEQVDTKTMTYGVNLLFQASDRLSLNFDLTVSDTDSPSMNRDYLIRNTSTQMTYNKFGPGGIPSLTSSSPLSDPEWFEVVKHSIQTHLVDDRIVQFRADASYEFGGDLIETFRFGVRTAQQDRGDRARYLNSRAFIGHPISEFGGNDPFPSESNFLSGLGNMFPSNIVNPNLAVIQRTFVTRPDEIRAGRGFATGTEKSLEGYVQGEFNEDLNHEDDSLAVYGMVTFSGQFGNTPYAGNFGVRFVDNDTSTIGQVSEPTGFDISDPTSPVLELSPPEFITVPHSYSMVLPSLNLRFDPMDDVVVRASVAKVMSRPSYLDLNPRFTGGGIGRTIRAGNGELDPTVGVQLDLALEWYFADYSIVSAGLFSKDIEAFVQLDLDDVRFDDVIDPDTNLPVVLLARRPLNTGKSRLTGVELAFQHTFEDLLPAPFDGLGVIANYTYVNSGSDFRNEKTGAAYSIPGLSENTINLTVFYEKDAWRGRVSYNFRDDFLDSIVDGQGHPYFVDTYDQIDASFGYALNERIVFSLEAINLTDENVYYYNKLGTGTQKHFSSAINAGRRFQFGVRFKM